MDKSYIPATSIIDENGYLVDKIDYPFVNELEVITRSEGVDLVKKIEDFKPSVKHWQADL